MAAKKRGSRTRKRATRPAPAGRLAQLEAMVSKLRANLAAEVKRRKLDQRVLAEAKRAREAVTKQMTALRAQGASLAVQIKRAAKENQTLEQARKTALAKVEELRAELHDRSEEVRRTSAELARLARESATRAREIVHSRGLGTEPHHEPDMEVPHADEPFDDDPFSGGEKPPI
jgi:predicted nuclease with TOPRIM domain